MKFNYGDTLRIRNELYTILGKIRYIDTHWRIWYKYKLVKHKTLSFPKQYILLITMIVHRI